MFTHPYIQDVDNIFWTSVEGKSGQKRVVLWGRLTRGGLGTGSVVGKDGKLEVV